MTAGRGGAVGPDGWTAGRLDVAWDDGPGEVTGAAGAGRPDAAVGRCRDGTAGCGGWE
ncbi:hypothetical protein [Planomonospora algeriensis]